MTLLSSYSLSFDHAGFGRRCAAVFIDGIVLNLTMAIIGMLIDVQGGSAEEGLRILTLWIVVSWFYFAAMESSARQATLGKSALDIMVTDLDGRSVSFGRASARYFGKFISFLLFGIGFIMAAFTVRRQALHDKMAGCLVIRRQEK